MDDINEMNEIYWDEAIPLVLFNEEAKCKFS